MKKSLTPKGERTLFTIVILTLLGLLLYNIFIKKEKIVYKDRINKTIVYVEQNNTVKKEPKIDHGELVKLLDLRKEYVQTSTLMPKDIPHKLGDEEKLKLAKRNLKKKHPWLYKQVKNNSRYVYGAKQKSDPAKTEVFDCSLLTKVWYELLGVNLPRVSYKQHSFLPLKEVSYENMRRGDLIFFITDTSRGVPVTHVGIAGDYGTYIHAKGKEEGTVIELIDEKRKKQIVSIKRVNENEFYSASLYIEGIPKDKLDETRKFIVAHGYPRNLVSIKYIYNLVIKNGLHKRKKLAFIKRKLYKKFYV